MIHHSHPPAFINHLQAKEIDIALPKSYIYNEILPLAKSSGTNTPRIEHPDHPYPLHYILRTLFPGPPPSQHSKPCYMCFNYTE